MISLKENSIKALSKLKVKIITVYSVGLALWFLIWFLVGGFNLSYQNGLLWIPFLSCIMILALNLLLWTNLEVVHDCEKYDKELEKLQYVERNAAHMVNAITGLLLIAAAISVMKQNAFIPKGVIIFESIAFVCAVVGVLPKYWIPSQKPFWLIILRHMKTVPFTYAISLFLGGLIILLSWL